jgi:RNA polymerase sigma-70 factor (ECF subfamily)
MARVRARGWLDDDATEHLVHRIDAERDARAVLEALAELPEGQRAVVELVAVDGLTLSEAAQALGISSTNARVRYHRARRV